MRSFTEGSLLREIGRDLLDLVFPVTCLACGLELPDSGSLLCPLCRTTVIAIDRRGCRRCGAEPLPGSRPRPSRCRRCTGRDYAFRRAVAAKRYGAAVRDLVLAVKFRRRREGIRLLGRWLAETVESTGLARRVSLVVPVPLHPVRRMVRGFDQAELLARVVASETGLPLVLGSIRRRRPTRAQAQASPSARRQAMAGAFVRGWRQRAVRGRSVLLVDDVMSTGATADAAARALREAGARQVLVGVAAT